MARPTEMQRRVYDRLTERIAAHAYPPTVRELADDLGLAASTVHVHLEQLKAAGWVTWQKGKPRTLQCLYVQVSDG